jgi:UDP-glucose 4-epimerase
MLVRGRTVLVIGFGFIGRHLVRHASALERDVVVLSRSAPSAQDEAAAARWVVGDAADPGNVVEALRGVTHVVYCAGGLFPAQSVQQPWEDLALALRPLLTVLEELKTRPECSLIFLSSGGTVYGNPVVLPVPEDHPMRPITAYGASKAAAEHYLQLYATLYGIRVRILRFANVYGEGQPANRGQGAVATFLECARLDTPVVIYGDGTSVRDFIHISDAVKVISQLLECESGPRTLNVASGVPTSLNDLLESVSAVTGRQLRVDWRPARAFDVRQVYLDITQLKQRIDFSPISLRSGLERTWLAIATQHATDYNNLTVRFNG